MHTSVEQAARSPLFPVFPYSQIPDETGKTAHDSRVIYPERDGKPMGETQFHIMAIMHLYQSLEHFFRHHPDVYISADMLMYYEKNNPKAVRVPDVMVVKGVEKHMRRIFKLWEEKSGPCVIFEITSKSTAAEDMIKTCLYSSLGVREYFLFDPLREYLEDSPLGFRLDGVMYSPIPREEDGSLFSKELGLSLKREGHLLRLHDPETGLAVPSLEEAVSMAEEESARAEEEARKAARFAAKLREMGIDPESV